jgi:SAM-dependent methyltransferase
MSALKQKFKNLKHSSFLAGRLFYRILKQLSYPAKLIINDNYRAKQLAEWKFGKHYYQKETFTAPNRYPKLFEQCKLYLNNKEQTYILSFGCSTGEEVASISEYLPRARIMGVDINKWCINQCRNNLSNPQFSFHHSLSKVFKVAKGFDAIFCMAVFQRTENRTNPDNTIAGGFKFEQFEKEISLLDDKLRPGGLFIIDQTDFRFMDTGCSKYYKPLDFAGNKTIRERPVFDRNNQKIDELNNNYRMFVKL